MERHDTDLLASILAVIIHYKTHMFEKPLKVLKLLQRLDEFLEVFQTTRRLGRLVVLPHLGIAALVQDDLGQFHVRDLLVTGHAAPTDQPVEQFTQLHRALAGQALFFQQNARTVDQWHAVFPCGPLDFLLRLVTKAAFGRVHNPLERQIVGGRGDQSEIGHRIADLHPLIEARAADHPVGQSDGQEPILKCAHLV